MEETISIKSLVHILKKRIWLILLITLLTAIISGVVSFFVLNPVYEARTQILVNQAKSDQQLYDATEVQTNVQLINTYNVIIKSPVILNKVKDELNLKQSIEGLNGEINVSSATNSQVVEISVKDQSPYMAAKIANKTAEVFQKEISKIMNVDNITILSQADIQDNIAPVSPKPFLNIGIAIIIGLMLGIGIVFVLEYLDTTIKTEQDVETSLNLPVMGVITVIKDFPQTNSARNLVSQGQRTRGETYGS